MVVYVCVPKLLDHVFGSISLGAGASSSHTTHAVSVAAFWHQSALMPLLQDTLLHRRAADDGRRCDAKWRRNRDRAAR